jgi:hypothetical protein
MTLATGIEDFTTNVVLTSLPGSDQALVRVLVSDGFHTGEDVSDGTFTNAFHAPVVEIESPNSGTLFVEDQMIILRGSARDTEDGDLSGASLAWVSSLDGDLGSGKSIAVNASGLTEGDHTITLNANDSDSQLGTDTIVITVYRNRPFLAPSLATAPDFVTFSSIEGDSAVQTLDIALRNNGDGTITWESSSDQGWLTTGQGSGFTPADFELSVSTAGLSPGIYNGTLTFTDTHSTDVPETVQVELTIHAAAVADFSADPLSGSAPLKVNFSNLSFGAFNACSWDFGDAETSDDCTDTTHTYTQIGIFSPSLTISGLSGTDMITMEDYIVIDQAKIFLPTIIK